MYKYICKRILMMIPVIIGVSLLVFLVLKMTPGDPARVVAGSEADEATVEQIREELGLNKPVLQQYVDYMLALLHGDMGTSYTTRKPVADEILARMPTTFILAFAGVFVAVLIGIPLGIISATKQYSVLDYISTLLALGGVAMPNFWLGLMLILLFSLKLGWLPSGGGDSWTSMCFPPSRWVWAPRPASCAPPAPVCWRSSGRTTSARRGPRVRARAAWSCIMPSATP